MWTGTGQARDAVWAMNIPAPIKLLLCFYMGHVMGCALEPRDLIVLLSLKWRKVAGRKHISEFLGIGEGSIRSTLARLSGAGLAEKHGRAGFRLTVDGSAYVETCLQSCGIRRLELYPGLVETLGCGRTCVVAEVDSFPCDKVTAMRDAVVMAGACGALFVGKGRRLLGTDLVMDLPYLSEDSLYVAACGDALYHTIHGIIAIMCFRRPCIDAGKGRLP